MMALWHSGPTLKQEAEMVPEGKEIMEKLGLVGAASLYYWRGTGAGQSIYAQEASRDSNGHKQEL